MRWPWTTRTELRQASYSDEVVKLLLAKAEGGVLDADGLAALEMAAGLIGRCFAAAEVEGDQLGLVTAPMLENVGRALVRQGTCAYAIEDGPRLTPAVGRPDVRGGNDPESWIYRLDLQGPSHTRSVLMRSTSVLAFRVNANPGTPWEGRAPHELASKTAETAAMTELTAKLEAAIRPTRLAPVPGSPQQVNRTGDAIHKGGVVILPSAMAGTAYLGGQESSQRWLPQELKPNPTSGHVELRNQASQDLLAAVGIPPVLFDAAGDGSAMREAYRQLTFTLLEPWGRLVSDELTRKLEMPINLDFARLHGADLATRGRALKQLTESGVPLDEALNIVGLNGEAV